MFRNKLSSSPSNIGLSHPAYPSVLWIEGCHGAAYRSKGFANFSRRESSLGAPRSDIFSFFSTWFVLMRSGSSSSSSCFCAACFFFKSRRSARVSSGWVALPAAGVSSSDSSSDSSDSDSSSSESSSSSEPSSFLRGPLWRRSVGRLPIYHVILLPAVVDCALSNCGTVCIECHIFAGFWLDRFSVRS